MGVAQRDYIPEGENETPQEEARRRRGAIIRTGSNHEDFIPDPDDPTPAPNKLSAQESADRAQAAANKRSIEGEALAWKAAVARLKGEQPVALIAAISEMPFRVMELYIVCETRRAARPEILDVFPTPGPEMFEQHDHIFPDFGTITPKAEEAPESSLGTADLGALPVEETVAEEAIVEETVVEPQTYDCLDCDFQGKTLAGFKAHERAKHGVDPVVEANEPQAGE